MNHVQTRVVQFFRETAPPDRRVSELSDEQIVRMMFVNYRPRAKSRGLRLTNFGLQFMRGMFQAIEVPMPEGHTVQARELLYLDKRATMPYHVSDTRIVVFEMDLGIMLRLADGDIATLIEIEGGKAVISTAD